MKLGQTSSTGQPLHGDLGQTRQGLVGDHSSFYDGTVGAAQNFNRGVFWLLAVIDYVRLFPPTSRTPHRNAAASGRC